MINPLILGPVLEVGKSLLDRWFPDQEAKRKAEAEFMIMLSQQDLQATLAQLEVNAKEAAHPSILVSGWRPAFGWMGALGVFHAVMIHPILAWLSTVKGWPVPPEPNYDVLMTISLGILGLGGSLRTIEKIKGATK